MKLPAIFTTTVLLAASSALFAENPPPATSPTTPAGGAKPAPKPALAEGDKRFLKEQTESLFFVMDCIGQINTNGQSESVKKLGTNAKEQMDKVWADVAGFATNNGQELPSVLKGGDKSASERLKKADKKNWDKEFLKATSKDVKKMAHAFKDSKSLSPDLKTIADKWGATMGGFETDWDNAEKEAAKPKPPGQ